MIENVAVLSQSLDTLLDPGAAGVHQSDDGHLGLQSHLLHLGDLPGVGVGERASGDGEVLSVGVDKAAAYLAAAGNDAIPGAGLFQTPSPVLEDVVFHKGVGVEENIQPLIGGQLALFVLAVGLGAGQQVMAMLFQLLNGIHGLYSFIGAILLGWQYDSDHM